MWGWNWFEHLVQDARYGLRMLRKKPGFAAVSMLTIAPSSVAEPRSTAWLFLSFALLALGPGTVGVYSVISYSVVQRFHEIGVRVALGAAKRDVLEMVLKEGMGLAVVGVGVGLIGSLAASQVLSSLLHGVKPRDAVTFLAVSLLMPSVALLACYIPARRATQVDPMVALRYE